MIHFEVDQKRGGRAGPTVRRTRRLLGHQPLKGARKATEKEKGTKNKKSTLMHSKVLATGVVKGRQMQVLPRAPKWRVPVLVGGVQFLFEGHSSFIILSCAVILKQQISYLQH